MPRVIPCISEEKLELGDLIETLNREDFDPADEESFAAAAPLLKGLANNRTFLATIAVEELKSRCERQTRESRYGSPVIMLHRMSDKYLLRANFWPSERDSLFNASGASPFSYYIPHDHNFSFLTVGYIGPGYWSDYYEYDYEDVVGYPGEKVDLRFVERSRLEPGKVMLYRAHRDVHNQLPADEMSISINVMEASPRYRFLDQYKFDVKKCEIAGILSITSSEAVLAIAAQVGEGNAHDVLESIAASHPCDRLRFSALKALAATEDDFDRRLERIASGIASASPLVAALSAQELAKLESYRHWIERRPNPPPASAAG